MLRVKTVNSFCLALMICSRALTQLLNFPKSSIVVALFGALVIAINLSKVYVNKWKVTLSAFVIFFFVVTMLLSDWQETTTEYLLYFVVFGLAAFLPPCHFDYRQVFQFILLFGLILIWPYVHIDYVAIAANVGGLNDNVAAVFMDISYKTLVFVVTGFLAVFTERDWRMKVLGLVVAVPYLIISFVYGARGALLSISVFFFLLWIICADTRKILRQRVLLVVIICLFVYLLFPIIISGLYNLLQTFGIEARSVERLFDAVSNDASLSQARGTLARDAINGFLDSPLWGNGIGSFDHFSGVYPHNIILQLLYEGGILLALPLLFCLFKGMYTMVSLKYNRDFRLFLLMLFCSGVIELFLSSHLWMSLFFWLFAGQSLPKKIYIRRRHLCPRAAV